jgi:hypothetical protein
MKFPEAITLKMNKTITLGLCMAFLLVRYDVIQDCYEENNDNVTYCNTALITNLVPYNYDGDLIPTISMQLQDRYQNIYENLIDLQEYSQEYVSSQTMNIMDIQLAIIGWFT